MGWPGCEKRGERSSILLDPDFCGLDGRTMPALTGHPCDETAVAVLLGTPKLSPPPYFLAREVSAPTAP
eukprot:scaffold61856_cov30-Phaeocystis_antarctica.AAC.1